MEFHGIEYQIAAELGCSGGCHTLLLVNRQKGVVVYKEIPKELALIYGKLQGSPHPNLIQVYEIKALENGQAAVFLEYFPSVTLEEKLEQEGCLAKDEMKRIMLQICAAVHSFHRLGIIHRDLNPANILINKQGVVKITDFGIARVHKQNQLNDTTILGTAGYAAPEQFGFQQTDGRTDIYALGVMMNEMLTGKMINEKIYRGEIPLYNLIRQCTSISMEERCGIDEIEAVLVGKAIHKKPIRKRMIKKIPGFRTGKLSHMVIASFVYLYMFLMWAYFSLMSISWSVKVVICRLIGLLINTIGIGWFVGSFETAAYHCKLDKWWKKLIIIPGYVFWGFFILWTGFSLFLVVA